MRTVEVRAQRHELVNYFNTQTYSRLVSLIATTCIKSELTDILICLNTQLKSDMHTANRGFKTDHASESMCNS